MKTMCLHCCHRPAAADLFGQIVRGNKRFFCSLQCAAWALHQVDDELTWCPDCSKWFLNVEGCTTCTRYTIVEQVR